MNESKNVLLVGELSRAFDKFSEGLKSYYDTVKVELGTAEFETAVEGKLPALIVIYIEEFIKWKLFPVKKCMNEIAEAKIPVAVVAKAEDAKAVKNYLSGIDVETLEQPIDFENVLETFSRLMLLEDGTQAKQSGKKKIIVVENDNESVKIIANTLGQKYDVLFAPTIGDAFAFYGKYQGELIVFDYSMSGCSGANALKMFKEAASTRDVPVICIEDSANKDNIKEAIALKPTGILLRPLIKEELVDLVEKTIK